jgi:hypothetical protein
LFWDPQTTDEHLRLLRSLHRVRRLHLDSRRMSHGDAGGGLPARSELPTDSRETAPTEFPNGFRRFDVAQQRGRCAPNRPLRRGTLLAGVILASLPRAGPGMLQSA